MVSHKNINITACRPLGTEIVRSEAPEGLTISQMLWNGCRPPNLPYRVMIWLDGQPLSEDSFDIIIPRAGSNIMVRTYPRRGGGTFFRAVLMIAVIAASIYAPYAAPAAWGLVGAGGTLTGMGIATSAAIGIIGSLAVNALIPPQVPNAPGLYSDTAENPTLWITGAKNADNRWGAVPVILGRHRIVPFYAAKPFTQIIGNDQYFNALFCLGYGPLQISDFKLGDTPLSSFVDYQMEIRSGYSGEPAMKLVTKQVDEASLSILIDYASSWQQRTTEDNIDEFQIDLGFLRGLTQYDDSGNRQQRTVQLDGRYRKVGEPDWRSFGEFMDVHAQSFILPAAYGYWSGEDTYVHNPIWNVICVQAWDGKVRIAHNTLSVPEDCIGLANVQIDEYDIAQITDIRPPEISGMLVTDAGTTKINVAAGQIEYPSRLRIVGQTSQALRRSISIVVPERGQYEVALRRITADADDSKIIDECHWIMLRSIVLEDPVYFPEPLALVALRIKATDQVSAQLDEFNCIVQSIVPDWDPNLQRWVNRTSSNPASLYRHVLQGPANARPQANEDLDLDWFQDFWEFCYLHEFEFNSVIASAKSVYEQCLAICAAGRATPQRVEGKWRGVVDQSGLNITGHYTPHNSWGLEFGGEYPDLPHAWRVRFLDETNNWQQCERIVYADGYDAGNATLFEAVDQQGVTNPDQIQRLWRYNYACAKQRPFPFSFYVDWEHLANTRGDLIRCTYYELMGQVFTGRIKVCVEVAGNHVLTLDNAVIMAAETNYAIRIRLNSGASMTGEVITEAGESAQITINGLLSQAPTAGDLFQFGEFSAESVPAIIKEIEPVDKLCARIICLDYAESSVFTADSEEVPEWNPVFNEPTPFKPSRPPIPDIVAGTLEDIQTLPKPDGNFTVRVGINYTIPPASAALYAPAEHVQVQYRPVETDLWQILPAIPSGSGVFYLVVEESIQYEVRIRAVTKLGVTSAWSSIHILDPAHQTITDSADDTLTDSDDNEIIVKEKAAPATVSGLTAEPGFRAVKFFWTPSRDLYHMDYAYRIKIGSAIWSDWLYTKQTEVLRILTQEEIDTHGIDAVIYFEVKDRNVFEQRSLMAALTSGMAESIRQVDLSGEAFQIIPSDSDVNDLEDLKELFDAVEDSGGIAYDGSVEEAWVQFAYPVNHVFNQVLIWPSASLNCYLAYSEDGENWNFLKAEADHSLDSDGKLLEAIDQADAQANYWTTGAGAPIIAKWPYMRQARYLRLYVKSSVTIYELKFWTYIIADEIEAGIIHCARGITIASSEDNDNAVKLGAGGLKGYGGGVQKVNIANDGTFWFGNSTPGAVNSLTFAGGILMVGNAVIKTAAIADLNVTTLKIANQAVTIPVSAYTAGEIALSEEGVTIQSASITSTGAPIMINASAGIYNYSGGATQYAPRVKVFRDAVEIYDTGNICSVQYAIMHSFCLQDTPGSGSFTYYVKGYLNSMVNEIRAKARSLLLLETKK